MEAIRAGWQAATSFPSSTSSVTEPRYGWSTIRTRPPCWQLTPVSNQSEFCSRRIDTEVTRARQFSAKHPNAAGMLWARIDRDIVGQAPWVPLYNRNALVLLSRRVGNFQFHPFWELLLDQLWVR